MDDNYLDEVLPRWQFWKEYLITIMEDYQRAFKWDMDIYKLCSEMIEKIREIESAEKLKEIVGEIREMQTAITKSSDCKEDEYKGVYWSHVLDDCVLMCWLNMDYMGYFVANVKHKK
jgi:hypothetical protein